jgi:hypothetical protein
LLGLVITTQAVMILELFAASASGQFLGPQLVYNALLTVLAHDTLLHCLARATAAGEYDGRGNRSLRGYTVSSSTLAYHIHSITSKQ